MTRVTSLLIARCRRDVLGRLFVHQLPASVVRPMSKTAAVVLLPAGVVLIALAYHHAAGLTGAADQRQFLLFWVGFLGAMLPLFALACNSRIDEITRGCALVGIGLFGMVPKMLRTPSEPLGGDESSHMRQIIEAFLNGDVGHMSYLLPITQEFPSLHQLISAIAHLTGLPLWQLGMAVIAVAHVLSVVAVYQLIRAVGGSPTGAALGAVLYALNPSWAYFDTAVSYESLALPLLLWCLTATVAASLNSRHRLRHLTVGLLCAAVLPLVHHLTTILLFGILVTLALASLASTARRRWTARRSVWPVEDPGRTPPMFLLWETVWPLLLTTTCLLGSSAYWWSDKYDWLYAYLSPALTGGWTQLSQLLGLSATPISTGPSGERTLFGGAQIPPLRARLRSAVRARGAGAVPGLRRHSLEQPSIAGLGVVGVRGAGDDVLPERSYGADEGWCRGGAPVLGVQLHRDRRCVRPGQVVGSALRCAPRDRGIR